MGKILENILEVRVKDEIYGFDADLVEQILTVPAITKVPLSEECMLGVSVLSGKITNVLDLGMSLGSSEVDIKNDKARLITFAELSEGFVVDEVLNMIEIKEESFEEVDDEDALLCGFYKTENHVVQILDINKVIKNVSVVDFRPVDLDSLSDSEEKDNLTNFKEQMRALFFYSEGEKFAIDIENLRELIFVPNEITPVANSDILGVITLRDKVIPLLDINSLLGFTYKEPDEKSRVLIALHNGNSVAFLVDEVEEVKNIYLDDLDSLQNGEESGIIEYIYKDNESIASIISTPFIKSLIREHGLDEDVEDAKEKKPLTEGDVSEIAVFKIGDEEYAFDIEEVQEIIRYEEVTPIPEAPDFIEGILNLRGAIISIISLPKRLGFEENITDKTKIVVCLVQGEKIGFIVDDVNEILFVEDKYISKSTSKESIFDEVINLENGERVILKIKSENLIDEDTLENIKLIGK